MNYEAHCVSREQGREQGVLQGEAQALLRILAKRFGELPEALRADIECTSLQQHRAWLDLALDAQSLDELLCEQSRKLNSTRKTEPSKNMKRRKPGR